MEAKDYITLGISILALAVSIVSIYLSRKWNIQARQGERREPFYKEMRKTLDFAERTFIAHELTVYVRRSFQEELAERAEHAHLLGLSVIEDYIITLGALLERMDEFIDEDPDYVKNQLAPSVRDTVNDLIDAVDEGIDQLNYRRASLLDRIADRIFLWLRTPHR